MRVASLFLLGTMAFSVILLNACGGNAQVDEQAVSKNTVAEEIYINNCGNPASAEQTSEHSQSIIFQGGIDVGFEEIVKGSLEAKYSSTKGIVKSQKVTAAPNTNMKFVLLWTEQISEGTVTVNDLSGKAVYRVSVPISVRQASAEDLLCLTSTPTVPPQDMLSEVADSYGIPMRFVPEGEFTMGSNNGYPDEQPVNVVFLNSFYIDKYEVTNAFYKLCVDSGVCQPPDYSRYTDPGYSNHPVVMVDWFMANSYCSWRGGHLPTEAEWEKASRGTDERTYPWGNDINKVYANFDQAVGDTMPVGSYESGQSPYGVYDMSGNVWEWVNSLYKPYPYSSDDGREDVNAVGMRVFRGGAYEFAGSELRSAVRYPHEATDVFVDLGFRCAKNPVP